jgi:autotransporter-associated beta strand protein
MRPKALSGSIAKYSRGLALSALALIGAPAVSQAADYTWIQNSAATQDWTTTGNWLSGSAFTGPGTNTDTLTFFANTTTALANGSNLIITNVTTPLTMNVLTLNGLGAAATGAANITIGTNAATWTLDGTNPTVNLNGLNNSPQQLNYTVAVNLALAQVNTLFTGNGTAGFTFSGVISGTVAGNGITKSGTSTLTLSGANTYTGTTTINAGITNPAGTRAGTLTVSGASGSINFSSGVTVGTGATLNLNNASGSVDRIKDTATLTLNGGSLEFTGNGTSSSTTETIGTLAIGAGGTTITLTGAGASRLHTLSASSFSRTGNGTALIRGTSLQILATNATRLLINGPSGTGLDLVGGGTAAVGTSTSGTTTTLSIVPYFIGDTSNNGNGSSFLTYDTTTGTGGGLRPLAAGEYTTLSAGYTTPGTPENVNAFNGTITTANPTVNSLRFNTASQTLAGSGTLTVNSGAIAATANTQIINGFTGITLGNGTTWNQGIITATFGNSLTINVPVAVSGGGNLVKTGAGTVTLAGNNTFSGLTLNGGTVQVSSDANLGAASGQITFSSDSTLLVNGIVSAARQINLTGGTATFRGTATNQSFTTIEKVTGSGNIRAQGVGSQNFTLSLGSTSNDFTGSITIDANNNGGGTIVEVKVASLADASGSGNIRFGATNTVSNFTQQFTYTGASDLTLNNRRIEFSSVNGGSNSVITSSGAGAININTDLLISGLNSDRRLTLSAPTGVTSTFSGKIVDAAGGSTPALPITKSGAGTWVLSGANTYTGATSITGGTLIARNGTAFGTTSTANVTVATQTGLSYYAATDVPLNIGGTLAITGGTLTVIGGSIGSTTTSARINVAGNATTTAAAIKVNIYGNSFSGTTDGTGTYTLIQGLAGGPTNLSTATYTLGTVFNATNFTVGALSKTTTTVDVGITAATALTGDEAYWRGTATAGLSKVWAASNGSADSNWAKTAGGSVQSLVPGSAANVFIAASPTVAATTTTLGADMTIKTLNIQDTTNGLGLNADGYTLTITPASSTVGITMDASVPASTIAANVALGASQTWTNNSVNSLTVSGRVSGGGNNLTTAGTGTIILSGANTYTGATTISAGTLQIGNSGTTGSLSPSSAITNDAALVFKRADTITQGTHFASTISGTGTVTQAGTGTLVLSGSNSYGGVTNVNSGTLNIQNNSALGTATNTINVASGAKLQLQNGITVPSAKSLTISQPAMSATNGTATNLGGYNILTFTASGTLTVTSGGNVDYLVVAGGGGGGIGAANWGGGGGGGAGEMLEGAVPVTASVTPYVVAVGAGGIGTNGVNSSFAGVTATGGGKGGDWNIAGSAGGSGGGGGGNNKAGGAAFSGNIGGTGSMSGAYDGAAGGGGQLTAGGNASNGTAGSGGAGKSSSITGSAVTYAGGGGGGGQSAGGVGGAGGGGAGGTGGSQTGAAGAANTGGGGGGAGGSTGPAGAGGSGIVVLRYVEAALENVSGNNTFSGAITLGSSIAISSLQDTLTLGGAIGESSSGYGITKIGNCTLALSVANTYSGATSILQGTLEVTANNALGTNAAGTTVASGATLKLTGVNYSTTEGLTINGTGVGGGGALLNSGTSTFGGLITALTSATINAGGGVLNLTGGLVKDGTTLTFTGGGSINISSVISGASANSDLVVDATSVTLDAANTYNGPTTITNGGTLIANALDALPLSPRSAVSFTGTGTSALNLGANQFVASLSSAGAATVALGSNTLTVGIAGGNTTFAGSIGGTGGNLVKDTNSTQVLSGANGYTGTTTVNGGTLEVQGSLSGTTAVTVNTGGTLLMNSAASDIMNTTATVAMAGGTLAFGNAANQIQNLGAMTLTANSILDFGAGGGNDKFHFAGFVNTAGTLAITNWLGNDAGGTDGAHDRLVFTGLFTDFTSSFSQSQISFNGSSGYAAINFGGTSYEIVPVPEPATTALIGSIALCALIGYRERRRFTGLGKRIAARK